MNLSVDDRHTFARAQKQVLAVSMRVGIFIRSHVDGAHVKIVVMILAIERRDLREKSGHIFDQLGFGLVDLDRRCGVTGKHNDDALRHPGAIDHTHDFVSYVHKLWSIGRRVIQVFAVGPERARSLNSVLFYHLARRTALLDTRHSGRNRVKIVTLYHPVNWCCLRPATPPRQALTSSVAYDIASSIFQS